MLSAIAGMTGTYHYTQLFSAKMGVSKIFAGADLKPSDLSLLHSVE
jgi:hypothetical protein